MAGSAGRGGRGAPPRLMWVLGGAGRGGSFWARSTQLVAFESNICVKARPEPFSAPKTASESPSPKVGIMRRPRARSATRYAADRRPTPIRCSANIAASEENRQNSLAASCGWVSNSPTSRATGIGETVVAVSVFTV